MNKRFKGTPTIGENLGIRVDRDAGEAGIIYGISVIQSGVEALGHGLQADYKSLAMLQALGNARKTGIRSRFGHPNASESSLGKQVAKLKNFRISDDGRKLLADSWMLESAKISPTLGKNPVEYIMTKAENEPEDFAHSIVFSGDAVWVLSDGDEIPAFDADGDYIAPPGDVLFDFPVIRPSHLNASDFVDEPAANRDGLFSVDFGATDGKAEQFTNAIDDFLLENGISLQKAFEFAARYFYSKSKGDQKMNFNNIFRRLNAEAEAEAEGTAVDGLQDAASVGTVGSDVEAVETAVDDGDDAQTAVDDGDDAQTAVDDGGTVGSDEDEDDETAVDDGDDAADAADDGDPADDADGSAGSDLFLTVATFEQAMIEFGEGLADAIARNNATMTKRIDGMLEQLSAFSARLDDADQIAKLRRAKPTIPLDAIARIGGTTPEGASGIDGRTTFAQQKPKETEYKNGSNVEKINGRVYPKR